MEYIITVIDNTKKLNNSTVYVGDDLKKLVFKIESAHAFNGSIINRDTCDLTDLIMASSDGRLEIITWLIEKGIDVCVNKNRALKCASGNGHLDIVKLLVEHGADIHDNYDEALYMASKNKHDSVIDYLVENGANINDKIMIPVATCNNGIVNFEFEFKNSNEKDNCNLVIASAKGNLNDVKNLIDGGADIHYDNDCALRCATVCNRLEVVNFLIENGALHC